jgi:hypothetical protein
MRRCYHHAVVGCCCHHFLQRVWSSTTCLYVCMYVCACAYIYMCVSTRTREAGRCTWTLVDHGLQGWGSNKFNNKYCFLRLAALVGMLDWASGFEDCSYTSVLVWWLAAEVRKQQLINCVENPSWSHSAYYFRSLHVL